MIFYERPADFQPWFEVAACLCEYDGRILLLKRLSGKFEGDKWGAPGGKIDPGETREQGLIRELREETGIMIEPGTATLAQTFYVQIGKKSLVYYLHRLAFSERPTVTLNPLEHTEYSWVSVDEALNLELVHDMEECLRHVYQHKR